MSALIPRDPFEQMLPEFFRRFARPMRYAEDMPGEIKLDITENEKDYEVRAEIPGAKKEDIRVTVDGNYVSIFAESRKDEEEKSGGRVVLRETSVGSVSRGFSLAHDVDAQRVVARLEDGVLKLTLPKQEGTGKRAIEIQ